jgi:hypothetical protein
MTDEQKTYCEYKECKAHKIGNHLHLDENTIKFSYTKEDKKQLEKAIKLANRLIIAISDLIEFRKQDNRDYSSFEIFLDEVKYLLNIFEDTYTEMCNDKK